MSITPAAFGDTASLAQSAFIDDEPPAGTPDEPVAATPELQSGIADELQAGVAGLEQRFMAFTQMLRRELSTLERQLTAALRSILGTAKRTTASPGQSGDRTSPAENTSPTARSRHSIPSPYAGLIGAAAERNGLDPALLGAVISQESDFRPDAVSSAGAIGLMQLMPATAHDLGVNDPFDARQNVDGGARLLRTFLDRYEGRLDLALAAYNAGPAAVDRYGGVPPFRETREYVSAIMARYRASVLHAG